MILISNNKDMLSLVNTLLDVYKIEDGVFQINKNRVDINSMLEEVVSKIKFIASESNLKIKIINKSDIKEICADEIQISRVITNILTNAINFAPQNSDIKIDVYSNKETVSIAITDRGSGISPENIKNVFDRYFTKKYRKVGTGLGLYLSKKIVRLHGGDITVESIPNKKTTFTVELPIK